MRFGIVYKESIPNIVVDWEIQRAHEVVENFGRSSVYVFVVCRDNKIPLECSVNEFGHVVFVFPKDMPAGVWGIRAIWTKDEQDVLGNANAFVKVMRSEIDNVLGVSQNVNEATITDNIRIKAKSTIASYGLDGLSAYEMAVLKGKTSLSEEEWMNSQNEAAAAYGELYEAVQGRTLTDAQKLWLNKQMAGDLLAEAMGKYAVVTTTSGTMTYYADVTKSENMSAEVVVSLAFNNGSVAADSTPTGWTKSGNTYAYSLNGTTRSVAATTFKHTRPAADSTYGGLELEKKSEAKSLQVVNPCYYGFAESNNAADVESVVKNLTRGTAKVTTSGKLSNGTGKTAYYWIVTKGSASATTSGNSILKSAVTKSFKSPQNAEIQLDGYKVYISTNSAAAGGSFDNVSLNINI